VQLHFEPRWAPAFEPLIQAFSTVPVLVDHLGRPMQGLRAEHDRVVAWSRFANVRLKLSEVPWAERYPHRDPTAVVRRLAVAFGAERLLWGGAWGADVTAEAYRAARERALGLLPPAWGAVERAAVAGGNAAQLLGLAAGNLPAPRL